MADTPSPTLDVSAKKKARIEIIPLIDVVFFLLATFVLFTLSLNKIQSMDARLPVTDSPTNKDKQEDPMIIQASADNTVFINHVAHPITDVYSAVSQYKESQDKDGKLSRVLITGDDSAKYGTLIQILDYVKSAGITEMSLETTYRDAGK